MPDLPIAAFQEMLSKGNAEEIAAFLRDRFPGDRNFNLFDQLSVFVCNTEAELPKGLIGGGWDDPFLTSLEETSLSRRGPRDAELRQALTIGKELDFVSELCFPATLSALMLCVLAIKLRIQPTKLLAVVLMVRDEGVYLLEWLAHYRKLGIEHYFIYTNDNSDGSDELLESFKSLGNITLINNVLSEGVNPQRKAYQHATLLLNEFRDFEWALFIDADEFINFADDYKTTFPSFIAKLKERFASSLPAAVLFPWNWRQTDGAYSRDTTLLMGQYQHANVHNLTKCMTNVSKTLGMCEVHVPTTDENALFVDPVFDVIGREDVYSYFKDGFVGPVVEHFWGRSFVEFYVKKMRGDALQLPEGQFRRATKLFFQWRTPLTRQNYRPVSELTVSSLANGVSELMQDKLIASSYLRVCRLYDEALIKARSNEDMLAIFNSLRLEASD